MLSHKTKLSFVSVTIAAIACMGLSACGDDEDGGDQVAGSGGSSTAGGSAVQGAGRGGRGSVFGRGGSGGRAASPFPAGQMCPMEEPSGGSSCTAARGTCMFGSRVCDCITPGNTWACWAPSDCPTTIPAERSSCSTVGMTCSPTRGSNCTCTSMGWDCNRQYCPPAEPANGEMCEGATGDCTYGTRKCECTSSKWACWDPAKDCPAPAPPADNAMCTLAGVACMYEGGSCTCSAMNTWRCGRGVMNDTDAGM